MTTAALTSTQWSNAFYGAAAPRSLSGVRSAWRYEMDEVLGGAGGTVHELVGSAQKVVGAAAIGSSALPVVGTVPLVGSLAAYFGLSALKGAVRTAAENKALARAGVPESEHGGAGRFVLNTAKSLNPFS